MIVQTSPSTNKNIENARRSFERIAGKSVERATHKDIENWLHTLRSKGRSINTCRAYFSLLKKFIPAAPQAEIPMPKREPVAKRVLSDTELKHLLSVADKDHGWLASMLLDGPEITSFEWGWLCDTKHTVSIETYLIIVEDARQRGYTTFPFPRFGVPVHWVGGTNPSELIWKLDAHELNRRLKRISRKAGIGARAMNVTTIKYAHQRLISQYGNTEKVSKALGIEPNITKPVMKPAPTTDARLR